ncbi:hypothetical protein [Oxalobacter paraformigenes]|uniref:hypothetical protein n=1 Tax=Oxalobacter paraformigenes TaxID=556268 RepID=UPI0001A29CD7|nr:hypothetical protein [Oxalobacter paraformigenes]
MVAGAQVQAKRGAGGKRAVSALFRDLVGKTGFPGKRLANDPEGASPVDGGIAEAGRGGGRREAAGPSSGERMATRKTVV